MHIHEYERWWIIIITAVLGVFSAALVAGAVIFGVRLPEPAGFINPTQLENTEFANPGVRHMGDNDYTVTMLARMWAFSPSEIRVPVGSDVTFRITSEDITHGFIVEHHNANLEIVPGHIAQLRVTFDRPGTYRFLCHEYCGRGHHLMHGQIVVEEETTAMAVDEGEGE
jgi:cytochrome c oxidase subunit 2